MVSSNREKPTEVCLFGTQRQTVFESNSVHHRLVASALIFTLVKRAVFCIDLNIIIPRGFFNYVCSLVCGVIIPPNHPGAGPNI